MTVELTCPEVWQELSNYIDGAVDAGLRQQMETHIRGCKHCTAILDGTRNVIRLVGDDKAFDIPANLSHSLYARLDGHLRAATEDTEQREIPLGIREAHVPLGSHLLYFWESDEEFAQGVRFLTAGLERREFGVAFGHREALEKVQAVLRAEGHDPEQLIREKRLTLLRRQANAQATLSDIDTVIQAALRAGARAVRFLGNLGMGHDPLPAGEADVVSLEHQASDIIRNVPSVIVCMYDVRTLPGRLILKGGLEQHRLTVCADGVHENPYYRAGAPHLKHIQ
jgi:hypothetical protein